MEFNVTHESVCINEVIFDGSLEQSIELDYLLPDYCPSIFKVLKCRVNPKVTSFHVAGDKLTIDATAYIRILYVSEEDNRIRSLEQKVPFTKTVDLRSEAADPNVKITARCDYCNCRVVNPKRLDIRGAVTLWVKATDQKSEEIISGAEGMGIQQQNKLMNAISSVKTANKQFTVAEDLELGHGKPPMDACLYANATAVVTDYKVIANKVIAKGEILLHILYTPDAEDQKPEVMEHSVPISQIIDMEGVDEDHTCNLSFEVCWVEIEPKYDGEGESKIFGAQFMVSARCEAFESKDIPVISDVYSTCYECSTASRGIRAEQFVRQIDLSEMAKCTIDLPGELACVYDAMCDVTGVTAECADGCIRFTANLDLCVLALDAEGMPIIVEKSVPYTIESDCPCTGGDLNADVWGCAVSVDFSLIGSGQMELRAELRVCGSVLSSSEQMIVTEINIDEERAKARDDLAALTIYYADRGERVWDIAKRYNTSVAAIMDENGLEADELSEHGMLLIPIVE